MKKRHKLIHIVTITALSAMLLSGCSNERLEDELAFREIGISDMQKGDYDGAIIAFVMGKSPTRKLTSAITRRQPYTPAATPKGH